MKNTSKKKTLLAFAGSLSPVLAAFINQQAYVEASVVTLIGVALILGYDHLDDKEKQSVTVPEGVDEDTVKDLAERVGEVAEDAELHRTLDDVAPNDDNNDS